MQARFPVASDRPSAPWGRRMFWLGFYAVVLLGWGVLLHLTASPLPGVTAAEYWAALCMSAEGADPLALFAMWVLMSAAMMLPTFVPAVRVFGELGSVRATDGASMAALVAGYGVVWVAFSALAAAVQLLLAKAGALSGVGQTLSPWATAGLLFAAGAYQFSTAKEACLAKCRHPLMFFMEHWAPGLKPAFGMGVQLGSWCVGCCWMLMLLGLVGGAMNLWWMGVATLFMALEKLPELGRYLTRPLGASLLVAAVVQTVTVVSWGG
jgi:predicted metal-binding membrane protein